MLILLVLPISINNKQITPSVNFEPNIDFQESRSIIVITSEIIIDEPKVKANPPINDDHYEPKDATLTPTTILRGQSFTVKGQLYDNITGTPQPIPNEEIIIFWNVFDWDDYAVNPTAYKNLYAISSGQTNSNGNFSINCIDTSRTKPFGLITVHTVWAGNPLYGKIEDIRQDIQKTIECYATTKLDFLTVDPSVVREGKSFLYGAAIRFDNGTSFSAANGHSIAVEWLGNTTSSLPFVSSITGGYLDVPSGTTLGNHILKISYNVSALNIPYVVGSITTESSLGSTVADWCNKTYTVNVFSGAGVTFNIEEPISVIPGQYPEVLRGSTQMNITGVLTDSNGDPYGYGVDLIVKVDNSTEVASVTTENSGDFSVLFQITPTLIVVGDHYLNIVVDIGQSIIAISELENITIVGNSTSTIPKANGIFVNATTPFLLAGETIHVNGTLRDLFSSVPLTSITIFTQIGSYGAPLNTTTSGTGYYSFYIQIPLTIDPNSNNETIRIWTDSIQYYTSWNTSFKIDVFTSVLFSVNLDQTSVVNGSTISSLGGNPIYNTTNFIFNLNITDNFGRALGLRNVTIIISIYSYSRAVNSNGNLVISIQNIGLILQNGSYAVIIEFTDNPTFNFGFTLVVSEQPITSSSTPPGGFNLSSQIAIGILISMVSLIIIISIVYAFGRYRKSKQQISVGASGEILDLQTIIKLIAEADTAKDYQRAVILCYQAFELICMQDLRILNTRSQSPRELARLVASTNRVPVRDVTMLVMRFEESRYSDHKISKNSFAQAIQALENIQLALKKESKIT